MPEHEDNSKLTGQFRDEVVADLAAAFGSAVDPSYDSDDAGPAGSSASASASKPKKKAKKRKKKQSFSLPFADMLAKGASSKKGKKGKNTAKKDGSPSNNNNSSSSNEAGDGKKAADKKKRTAKQRQRFMNEVLYLLLKIGIAVVAFAALLMLVVGAYRVSDSYMEPMVKSGDLIFFNRMDKTASAGDVIIVKYEGHETASRVIAKGGDTVDIRGGAVLVNGNHQFEDSIFYETEQISGGATFPLTVPQGQVFVLGDERKVAVDSRMFGCVKTEDIEGKLALVLRRREF